MKEKRVNPQNVEKVNFIIDNLKDAKSIILVNYKGLTVKEDTELRRKFKKNNVKYFVCKNTLLKHAVDGLRIKGFNDYLNGPTAVVISYDDEIIPVKLISNFAEDLPNEKNLPKFKIGLIEDNLMVVEDLKRITKLPSKKELLTQIVIAFNSPLSGFVISLKNILQKLVLVLTEIKSKKQ